MPSSHPALETLLLVFAGEDGLQVPFRALFIGAQAHQVFETWPDLSAWQPLKPLADAWERAGFSRAEDLPEGKWPVILLLPGKSRDETLLGFALAIDRLEPGGRLIAAMPNTAGASRFEKELAQAAGNITSLQKHKCRAFHTGQDMDIRLGFSFLTSAASAFKRHGRLCLVANRQLPYEAMPDNLGFAWRKVAEHATYKLLFCDKR